MCLHTNNLAFMIVTMNENLDDAPPAKHFIDKQTKSTPDGWVFLWQT